MLVDGRYLSTRMDAPTRINLLSFQIKHLVRMKQAGTCCATGSVSAVNKAQTPWRVCNTHGMEGWTE